MMQKTLLTSLLILILAGGFMKTETMQKSIPSTTLALETMRTKSYENVDAYATDTSLKDFVRSVSNGRRGEVVGVYVPGVLALPVGQQPKGNAGFVTREPKKTTQFSLAAQYGTIGILAHNDLAGEEFSGITKNQYAIVVYGDGRLEYYIIGEVQKYQALTPTSTFSDFINLDNQDEKLSASELFNRVYGPGDRLVFQTCIAGQGDASWGRMFIIAKPANQEVFSIVKQTSSVFNFASFGLASR